MIKLITDGVNNIYGVVSVIGGGIIGLAGVILNNKSKCSETTQKLHHELEEIQSELKGLKKAFSIVFDAYEREFNDDPERMGMLKDLKKEYNL
jgi:hypothetical protein